jgi:hypothetical protein
MHKRSEAIWLAVMVVFISGCGYSLPTPLQQEVDTMTQQAEGLYQVVANIKSQAGEGKIEDATLETVSKRYNELVGAHDDWRAQVKRAISVEIDNFENEDKYLNSVVKLANASNAFEEAADAALGGSMRAEVPDWAVESTELVTRAYNERKKDRAADIIYEQLRMKRWDEIGS